MRSRYPSRFVRPAGEPLSMGGYNGPITGPTIATAGPSASVAPLAPNTAVSSPVGSAAPAPLAPNTNISSPVGSAPIAPLNPVLGMSPGPAPAGPSTATAGPTASPGSFPSPALPVFGTAVPVPGTVPTPVGEEGVPWWLIALLLGGAAGLVYVSRKSAVKENPRRMPQEAIDRNIARDLEAVDPYVPEGQYGSVKTILTWLHGNEMSMIANFFVDTLRRGQFYQFYIDARVSGRPVSSAYSLGRVTKRDVNAAIKSLQAATKRSGQYHRQ